jgi:hypothetical protein
VPRLYVVCDTNVYRSLGAERFKELRARERTHSVVAKASYWVVHELVAHLASREDPSYTRSLAAVRRLAEHCTQYDGSRTLIGFLGDTEEHIDEIILHIPPKHDQAEAYGQLVLGIAHAASPEDSERYQSRIEEVAANVANQEEAQVSRFQRILSSMNEQLTEKLGVTDPIRQTPGLADRMAQKIESDEGMRGAAEMMVRSAAMRRSVELTLEEKRELEERMLSVFPFQLRLYNAVAARVVRQGIDMSSRRNRNWVWDWMVAFSTSVVAHVEGVAIWLITDDQLILDAAADADARGVVHTVPEYEALLALPAEEFAEAARFAA